MSTSPMPALVSRPKTVKDSHPVNTTKTGGLSTGSTGHFACKDVAYLVMS